MKHYGMKLPLLIVNRKSYNRATEVTPRNEATAFDHVHYIGILFCICFVFVAFRFALFRIRKEMRDVKV